MVSVRECFLNEKKENVNFKSICQYNYAFHSTRVFLEIRLQDVVSMVGEYFLIEKKET